MAWRDRPLDWGTKVEVLTGCSEARLSRLPGGQEITCSNHVTPTNPLASLEKSEVPCAEVRRIPSQKQSGAHRGAVLIYSAENREIARFVAQSPKDSPKA